MLVNPQQWIQRAQQKKVAIGAFNAYNLETARAIIQAAENLNSPVIVETTPKAIEYGGLKYLSTLVKQMAEDASVPVALHLDHGLTLELLAECIAAGYTSLMIDGSHLPLEENIILVKKAVEMAKRYNIPVEGELGTLSVHYQYTNPDEVREFVKRTGVFSLAVSIGSSHGHAPKEELNIDLLKEIRQKTDIPLVLHGASGVSDEDIKKAISQGICKINVDTQLREVFTQAIREAVKDSGYIEPRYYLQKATLAIQKVVEEKILLFGSINV
jgi:ketose-bisphosphate aldolase